MIDSGQRSKQNAVAGKFRRHVAVALPGLGLYPRLLIGSCPTKIKVRLLFLP
jgi:hypothetical protein